MAYQPKSYRKFLATSVAAAIVATGAVPAASLAAEGNFKDIEGVKSWAGDAIAYLVEKGAIEGFGNGEFRPNEPLTRGQIAKVLAIALDLDINKDAKTDFLDAKDHWASSYIKAIQDQLPGVINGFPDGTFRPEDPVTREQLAKIVVEAYGLEKDENADINFTDIGGWSKDFIETLASLGIVEGVGGGLFNPTGPVTRAQATVFVHRTEVEEARKQVPKKPAVELQVDSVKAINLNAIEVKFNQEVDKDTAQTITNYTLDGANLPAGSRAILQSDNKTLLIVLHVSEEKTQNQTSLFAVKANSVLSKDSFKTASKFEKEITFRDVTTPTVTSVTAKGNKKITVKFSEPVKFDNTNKGASATDPITWNLSTAGSTFKINGQNASNYSLTSVTLKDGTNNTAGATGVRYATEVDLEFSTALPSGTHTLTVSKGSVADERLVDAANFVLEETQKSFTIEEVTGAPQVTEVTGTTNGTVYVTYNRPMSSDALELTNYSIGTAAGSGSAVNPSAAAFVSGSGDKTVKLTFGHGVVLAGSNTLDIHRNVTDAWGNKLSESSNVRVSFTATEDKVKPTVTNVAAISETKIRVQFSKDVNPASATQASNYKLKTAGGTEVAVTVSKPGASNSVYELTVVGHNMTAGTYTLEVKNVYDQASPANVMDPQTLTFTGIDKTDPDFVEAVKSGDRKVTLYFDEPMNNSLLSNKANYEFSNDTGAWRTLPSTASVSVSSDNKSVTITFPTGYTVQNYGNGTGENDVSRIRISSSLTDLAGNRVQTITRNVILPASSSQKPAYKANSFKLFGNSSKVWAEFEFNQAIDTLDRNDFRVENQAPDVAYISGNKIVLEFTDLTKRNTIKAAGPNAMLTTVANNSKNAAGIEIAPIVGEQVFSENIAPTLESITAIDGGSSAGEDKVVLTFSENIDPSIAGLYGDDFIFENVTTGATMSVVGTPVVSGNTITYSFTDSIATNDTIRVRAVTDKIDIRDLADLDNKRNVYSPTTDDTTGKRVSSAALDGAQLSALQAAKDSAAALVESHYTTASWADLTAALALPETTNAEITAKTNAINNAIANLVVLVIGFDPIPDLDAGTAGSATYADASEVQAALPPQVTANLADGNTALINVTSWEDTDGYDSGTAGTYVFTADFTGNIPANIDLNNQTLTVNVVVQP